MLILDQVMCGRCSHAGMHICTVRIFQKRKMLCCGVAILAVVLQSCSAQRSALLSATCIPTLNVRECQKRCREKKSCEHFTAPQLEVSEVVIEPYVVAMDSRRITVEGVLPSSNL